GADVSCSAGADVSCSAGADVSCSAGADVISTALFYLGTTLYAASAYLYVMGWLTKHRQSQRWDSRLLLGAVVLLGGGMVSRTIEFGFPFLTMREVLSVYVWVLGLVYLILERRFGFTILGVVITPVGILIILVTSLMPAAQEPLLAMLQSPWLMAHVGTFFAAYAAFTLAFASAVAYLLQEQALRRKQLAWRLPPLAVMDGLSRWLVTVGLLLMVPAIFTGSAWAEQVWETVWVWEPKLILSLGTLGIYGLYFYARHIAHWSGRRTSWLVVLGFISVLTTFIGADLISPDSRHSFLSQ
ncbi:MAG: cytochrome c biogenesis protein, partial [Anaerolineae bacterium]